MTNAYLPEGLLIAKPENQAYLSSLQGLEQALLQGRILEATALLCDNTLRLHIDLGGMRGYIEKQECLYCRPGESIKDIAVITRVGKPVCFKVMRIERDENGPYAVLSRRLAQQECYHSYLSDLMNGDIIPAKVTHLENFGAFVDIGCGISSLQSYPPIWRGLPKPRTAGVFRCPRPIGLGAGPLFSSKASRPSV